MPVSLRLVGISILVVGVAGCTRGPTPLARVGEHDIRLGDFEPAVVAQTSRPLSEVSPELAASLFETYLEEEVILAAGGERSIDELSPAARSARARELVGSLCPPPPEPDDAQIDAYLATRPTPPPGHEKLRLQQLILPDRDTAETARRRARQGEDFTALSRELSRAPNAAQGGNLGWVERGQLPPEFEAAVFGLAPGDISAPVASNAGWHVFKVIDRRQSGGDATAEARDRARTALAAREAEAARRSCLRNLATDVGVRVFPADAPFPIRNPFQETP